jgi:hypothetical protein
VSILSLPADSLVTDCVLTGYGNLSPGFQTPNATARWSNITVDGGTLTSGGISAASIDLGAADTTLSRLSPGKFGVEGAEVSLTGHKHVAGDVTGALSWAAVPASATAAGTAGQLAYANGWLYVAVATNTWQRVALTTWA